MTDSKLIVKLCQRCGAPLIQKGREYYCEYCKTGYHLTGQDNDQVKTVEAVSSQEQQTPKPVASPPPILRPQGKLQVAKKKNNTWIFVILMIALFFIYVRIFGEVQEETPLSDANLQTEREMYQKNSTGKSDEFPAAFIHGADLSFGAILDSVSQREFEINLYARNLLDRTVIAKNENDRLVVTEVEAQDNLGNQYSCEIWNDFDNSFDEMESGEVEKIAQLNCSPGFIPADAATLEVHTYFTNWGDFTFQIPLTLDASKLQVEYKLTQYADGFSVEPAVFSTDPQYIVINYDDIFVVDDQGKYYALDHCGTSSSSDNDTASREIFIDMAEPREPGSYFSCYYKKSIPSDVESITFGMTIRGEVLTHLFPLEADE